MESNNLVSECFVINDNETGFVYPVIYLAEPKSLKPSHFVYTFSNPFTAKKFIRDCCGELYHVEVSKDVPSDLDNVICE